MKITLGRFFGLALLLFAVPAHAQNTQCRTAPVGTVSSNCASEAFVTDSVATAGNVTAAGTLTNGDLVSGSGGKAVIDSGITAASVSALFAAWTTYTPTVTSGGGAITAYTATGRYKQIGKTIICEMDVVITTVGTATGAMFVTLPITGAAHNYVGIGFDYGATFKSGAGYISAINPTAISVSDATGATLFAAFAKVAIGVTYEVP